MSKEHANKCENGIHTTVCTCKLEGNSKPFIFKEPC